MYYLNFKSKILITIPSNSNTYFSKVKWSSDWMLSITIWTGAYNMENIEGSIRENLISEHICLLQKQFASSSSSSFHVLLVATSDSSYLFLIPPPRKLVFFNQMFLNLSLYKPKHTCEFSNCTRYAKRH